MLSARRALSIASATPGRSILETMALALAWTVAAWPALKNTAGPVRGRHAAGGRVAGRARAGGAAVGRARASAALPTRLLSADPHLRGRRRVVHDARALLPAARGRGRPLGHGDRPHVLVLHVGRARRHARRHLALAHHQLARAAQHVRAAAGGLYGTLCAGAAARPGLAVVPAHLLAAVGAGRDRRDLRGRRLLHHHALRARRARRLRARRARSRARRRHDDRTRGRRGPLRGGRVRAALPRLGGRARAARRRRPPLGRRRRGHRRRGRG